jgi:hypothetical protein
MVEFQITVNPKQRVAYFPKEIVEALGFTFTVIPSRNALVLYPMGANLHIVQRSVEIILEDLKIARAFVGTKDYDE